MRKIVFTFRRSVIFFIKAMLYICLLASFFLLMGIDHPQMLRLSRTSGIAISTFAVVLLGMVATYGNFDIGKRKSKPIITSLGLATVITDLVTYVQLMIMNTNADNNLTFKLESFHWLVLIVIIQCVFIVAFTYFGNYVFFKMYKPEKCCIITDCEESLLEITKAVKSYKKQYHICHAKHYQSLDVYEAVLKSDTVFLYNIPVGPRTELMEFCYRNMINVYISPEISDIVEINSKYVILDDISLVSALVKELTLEQRIIKRTMDIVISILALIITSPLWLFCAISIKICDGGSVFFKQRRATKGGHIFEVYKFRTMKEHVDNYSSVADDDRITPVGRVLRKYRLDELPQFINILKGEMSMVGPRPEMLENVYLYTKEYPEFSYRLRVKAGLTGYAQIAGKYNTSPKYKLILDLIYIENYSVFKDIKLILQTLVVLFKSDSTEGFASKKRTDLSHLTRETNDWWKEV